MTPIYHTSLALLTDLYELTMAYGYWKRNLLEKRAVFHLNFRRQPFGGPFALAAGLAPALNLLTHLRFERDDLSYLASLKTEEGNPLFEKAFLDYLGALLFTLNIDAMPEGTPVFPYQPLLRVEGPILQAQLIESIFLNIINFQSLIATKAARICYAAGGDPVVEFGLRRAQGIDGALSATRGAYIGGCNSTSNTLAGKLFQIPVKGTHAHSWIMLFDEEKRAFEEFAHALPENNIFLIDTYNSLQGAKNAIAVFDRLKSRGFRPHGVRLDSGDLAPLSIEVRRLLDAAGYRDVKIMATNELDEYSIARLKRQGAQIDIWGVGTHLVTAKDQPALDGVYKLSAVQDAGKEWTYKVKISEQVAKVTNPGILQVRRYLGKGGYIADKLYDIHTEQIEPTTLVDMQELSHAKTLPKDTSYKDLLIPVMREGKEVYAHPSLSQVQRYAQEELAQFPLQMRDLDHPEPYFTGMDPALVEMKSSLMRTWEDKIG